MKSLTMNATLRRFPMLPRRSRAAFKFVPVPTGLAFRISVTTRITCPRPFLGGTKRSMRSVKRMSPTRSLFLIALNASSAAI